MQSNLGFLHDGLNIVATSFELRFCGTSRPRCFDFWVTRPAPCIQSKPVSVISAVPPTITVTAVLSAFCLASANAPGPPIYLPESMFFVLTLLFFEGFWPCLAQREWGAHCQICSKVK